MSISTNFRISGNTTASNSPPLLHTTIRVRGNIFHIPDFIIDVQINEVYDGQTPLTLAIEEGLDQVVEQLLQKGADPSRPNSSGKTPLVLAEEKGNQSIIGLLRNATALSRKRKLEGGEESLAKQQKTTRTPLTLCVEKGDFQGVKKCIEAEKVDINEVDDEEDSPLFLAATLNQIEIAEYLVQKGADVNAGGPSGRIPPLHEAAHLGHFEIAKMLLQNGAVVVEKADDTPFHLAARAENQKVMELLIQHKVPVDILDKDGWTPLYGAIACPSSVAFLLHAKADVNRLNGQEEQTALHYAISHNITDTGPLLLDHGANPCLARGDGKTAIDLINPSTPKEILDKMSAAQSVIQYSEEWAVFDLLSRVRSPSENMDACFDLMKQHGEIWSKKKDLAKHYFNQFMDLTCDHLTPLITNPEFQNSFQKHLDTITQNIKQAEDLAESQKIHDLGRKFLKNYTDQILPSVAAAMERYAQRAQAKAIAMQNAHLQNKETASSIRSKEEVQDPTRKAFDAQFGSSDLFTILEPFVAYIPGTIEEKYSDVFDKTLNDFYDYGLSEGIDLQSIGVDFTLQYYHEQLTKTPNDMEMRNELINIIDSKFEFIDAIGADKGSPGLVPCLQSLKVSLANENANHENLLRVISIGHDQLTSALINTFLSQPKENVVFALTGHLPRTLTDVEKMKPRKMIHELKKENGSSYSPVELYQLPAPPKEMAEEVEYELPENWMDDFFH